MIINMKKYFNSRTSLQQATFTHAHVFILSLLLDVLLYRHLPYRQNYADFIVGNIAWASDDKFRDLIALFAFPIVYVLLWGFLDNLSNRKLIILPNSESENEYRICNFILFSPMVYCVFSMIVSKNTNLNYLYLSSGLIFLYYMVLGAVNANININVANASKYLGKLYLNCLAYIGLAYFSYAAIIITISRVFPAELSRFYVTIHDLMRADHVQVAIVLILIFVPFFLIIRMAVSKNIELLLKDFSCEIYNFNYIIPLLLLVLIPKQWQIDGIKYAQYYNVSFYGYLVSVLLFAAAYILLYYEKRLKRDSVSKGLSIYSFVSILVFFKTSIIDVPMLPADDYHFGEALLPWWTYAKFDMIPMWDFIGVRGLVSYFNGFCCSVFFDGTVSAFEVANNYNYLLTMLAAFPVLSKQTNSIIAFTVLLFTPFLGLSQIDLLVLMYILCNVSFFTTSSKIQSTMMYVASSILILLLAPAQGAISVISVAPVFFLILLVGNNVITGFRFSRIVMVLFILIMLIYVMFMRQSILGTIRYLIEQAIVDAPANSVAWYKSFAAAENNPTMYLFAKISWLPVLVYISFVIIKIFPFLLRLGFRHKSVVILSFGMLLFLYTFRAAGRIDGAGPSRLGVLSIFALVMICPCLIFIRKKVEFRNEFYAIIALFGLINPSFTYGITTPWQHISEIINSGALNSGQLAIIKTNASDFPNIGMSNIDPDHRKKIISVKKVIDALLALDETYIDCTNHSSLYYYVDKKPPFESSAVYNMPSSSQQLRNLDKLVINNCPLILIGMSNYSHDGGGLTLRSFFIYRYIYNLDRYMSVDIGGTFWLIDKMKIPLLVASGLDFTFVEKHILFNKFNENIDLGRIPIAWGRSFNSLKTRLSLNSDVNFKPKDNNYRNNNSISDHGAGVGLSDSIYDWNVVFSGNTSRLNDVLYIDLISELNVAYDAELHWLGANNHAHNAVLKFKIENGKALIPLGSLPSWASLRADVVLSLNIKNTRPNGVSKINNILIYSRVNP